MKHIIKKITSAVALSAFSLLMGSFAFAGEPLKIDVDMINATCKMMPPDMLQCQGIKAMWTDPATQAAQSLSSVDVMFQWDPLTYNFKIKEVLGVQCNNTVRVQVVSVVSGEPLANATVSLRGQSVTTDEDGIARFIGVKTGSATINSAKDGFEADSLDITVACDALKHVAVRLMPKS
ncbi:MAG: carboxypeptidase-like regulatory domain-containing protein [Dissulfuribacterales bacterium]